MRNPSLSLKSGADSVMCDFWDVATCQAGAISLLPLGPERRKRARRLLASLQQSSDYRYFFFSPKPAVNVKNAKRTQTFSSEEMAFKPGKNNKTSVLGNGRPNPYPLSFTFPPLMPLRTCETSTSSDFTSWLPCRCFEWFPLITCVEPISFFSSSSLRLSSSSFWKERGNVCWKSLPVFHAQFSLPWEQPSVLNWEVGLLSVDRFLCMSIFWLRPNVNRSLLIKAALFVNFRTCLGATLTGMLRTEHATSVQSEMFFWGIMQWTQIATHMHY